MFKVPAWEEDVPKSKVDLRKNKIKKSEKKKEHVITPPKKISTVNKSINKPDKTPTKNNEGTKRKHNGSIVQHGKKKCSSFNSVDFSNIDTDKIDEALLNAKKKKFYEPLRRDDVEDLLFTEDTTTNSYISKLNKNEKQFNNNNTAKIDNKSNKLKNKKKPAVDGEKETIKNVFQVQTKSEQYKNTASAMKPVDKKKEKIRNLLQTHRNSISVSNNKLRERMMQRLKAAQFRYINERLYTSSGSDAKELFQSDPAAFQTYHQGYQQQLKKWPVNPLEVIIKRIQKMPKSHIIADMGCGEATLSKRVSQTVRSFDLVSSSPGVETCDMAHTPLLAASVDVTVYCLALMGTDLTQYLVEANRVLKIGGHLLIAEVESRFTDVDAFAKDVCRLGFKLKNLDKQHQVFFFLEFVKLQDPPAKRAKRPVLTLRPCMYKKR